MGVVSTILKFAGWLPFAVAAIIAGLHFQQSFNTRTLAVTLMSSLMVFVMLIVLIMLASAFVYQRMNGYFSFREVALASLLGATTVVLMFSTWVVISERIDANAVFVAAVGFPFGVALFWIGFVFALYVGPRVVGLR